MGFALRGFKSFGFRVTGFWFLVSEFQGYRVAGKSALICIFSVICVLIVSGVHCARLKSFGFRVTGFWFLVSELQCFRVTGKSALICIFSVIRVLIVSELQCYRVSDPT